VTITINVASNTALSDAEKKGISTALRGTPVKELGFSTAKEAGAIAPRTIILHDFIDMYHESREFA